MINKKYKLNVSKVNKIIKAINNLTNHLNDSQIF